MAGFRLIDVDVPASMQLKVCALGLVMLMPPEPTVRVFVEAVSNV